MIDGMTGQQQMVGDDAAMTSPPDRLGAHQGQTVIAAEAHQIIKRAGERLAERVVSVVVEACLLYTSRCV